MKTLFRIVLVLCLVTPSAFTQNLYVPRDPDKLIERVQAFWRSMTSGQRLQAAEFVLPEKKNVFLTGNPLPVVKAAVVGLDLTPERNTATVRVNITVLGTDLSRGPANWTISDAWIWRRGNWYVEVQDANEMFPENGSVQKLDEKKVQESIDKNFEILRNPIELGKLVDGQHFSIEVPIKYTGDLPLTVEPSLPNPVVGMPVSPPITAESKNLVLFVGTDDWEGPFNLPLVLSVKYRNVVVEKTLTVTGEVFVPLAFRQEPPNGPLLDTQDFSVFVKNNTDQDIRIRYLSVDAKVDIVKTAAVFPAHQETQLTFKPRTGVKPDGLFIQLESAVNGRDNYTFRFHNVQP